MSRRADEIRKRIEKRKRERRTVDTIRKPNPSSYLAKDEERYGSGPFSMIEGGGGDGGHPLFRKEVFMFKILLSAILVLSIAIIYKNQTPKLENVRNFVSSTMEKEFQFAAVGEWYEAKFGAPFALLPLKDDDNTKKVNSDKYSVPALGTVTESFEVNGQGVMVETESKVVEAMDNGRVLEVANKEGLGKTIIIQHSNGSESWYGNLKAVDVKLYDYVEAGQVIGEVMDEGEKKGTFYFAIKKDENFIDPIQVIQFD